MLIRLLYSTGNSFLCAFTNNHYYLPCSANLNAQLTTATNTILPFMFLFFIRFLYFIISLFYYSLQLQSLLQFCICAYSNLHRPHMQFCSLLHATCVLPSSLFYFVLPHFPSRLKFTLYASPTTSTAILHLRVHVTFSMCSQAAPANMQLTTHTFHANLKHSLQLIMSVWASGGRPTLAIPNCTTPTECRYLPPYSNQKISIHPLPILLSTHNP